MPGTLDRPGAPPIVLDARRIEGRPDRDMQAEGDVDLKRGPMRLQADRLTYDVVDDLAHATGNVRVQHEGNLFTGPEASLHVQRFEGYFLSPTYFFSELGGGGTAARVDFIDDQRARMTAATYSSCLADGSGAPAWLLSADGVKLDVEANEGQAEGAVLRFYGVPILAAPHLSFPLTEERKSGWLPPDIALDNKSGLQLAVPYYWNIAPQRDATITPGLMSRRGAVLGGEFRYLEPTYHGQLDLHWLPNDLVKGRTRDAVEFHHSGDDTQGLKVNIDALRVSDDDYWKDFPDVVNSLTKRLLSQNAQVAQSFPLARSDWTGYARVQDWQVLQGTDPTLKLAVPYQREPQLGLRYGGRGPAGLALSLETEFNRFSLPAGNTETALPTGQRVHVLGSVARPIVETPGWTLTPKLAFNAASYDLDSAMSDGRRTASRVIPTFSVDSAWVLERDADWFGRAVRQTLEPRLLYVNTPVRDQLRLPNFDSAPRDFNLESIYSDNLFTGVDRVSDAHQLTAGVTTRFLAPDTGVEALRLGAVQRVQFRDQQLTTECVPVRDLSNPTTTPTCEPSTQRLSDLLLLASTGLVPNWNFDAQVQYSPHQSRTMRSILGARYSPGPYRTVNLTYRYARDFSEQLELGWQWPVWGVGAPNARLATPEAYGLPENTRRRTRSGPECAGQLYSVGRMNYSMRDSRITDSIIGFEYDAGCWIGRVVAERLSTGRSEATTRLMLQLELVGLSRLGSNPLQTLKDNIPGYRLLREERAVTDGTTTPP